MTLKKIFYFTLGPLGSAIISFLTLPIIAWYFTPEDIGRLAMLQVVAGLFALFFSFGLDQAYVREFHESKDKVKLLASSLLPGLLFLTLTLIVLLVSGDILSLILFDLSSIELSLMAALFVFCTFVSRFFQLVLRMNEQAKEYSFNQILPKIVVLSTVLFFIFYGTEKVVNNLIFALASSSVVTLLYLIWKIRRSFLFLSIKSFDWLQIKELMAFGFPLVFAGVGYWGLTSLDRVFLRTFSTYEELGLYSLSASLAGMAIIFQTVFSTVWAPMVYKWVKEGADLEKVNTVINYVLLVVILIFSFVSLFSWLIPYVLPSDYVDVQWVMIGCLGFPLFYTLSETTFVGVGVTKKTSLALVATLIALFFNVIGNYLLIPLFGASGAAISTCVSFYIFFIARTELAIYIWKPISRGKLYVYSSLIVFGVVFSILMNQSLGSIIYVYWLFILLSCGLTFRSEVQGSITFVAKGIKNNFRQK